MMRANLPGSQFHREFPISAHDDHWTILGAIEMLCQDKERAFGATEKGRPGNIKNRFDRVWTQHHNLRTGLSGSESGAFFAPTP
jgi:hypothetical protein